MRPMFILVLPYSILLNTRLFGRRKVYHSWVRLLAASGRCVDQYDLLVRLHHYTRHGRG